MFQEFYGLLHEQTHLLFLFHRQNCDVNAVWGQLIGCVVCCCGSWTCGGGLKMFQQKSSVASVLGLNKSAS